MYCRDLASYVSTQSDFFSFPNQESKEEIMNNTIKKTDASIESLNRLKMLKDSIEAEIEKLRFKHNSLYCEIDGIKISIASLEKFIHSYELNKSKLIHTIKNNSNIKEKLINDINKLSLKLKAVKSDTLSCKALEQNLKNDFNDIISEKNLLINRIMEIKEGLTRISKEKENRIPSLIKCNDIIKRLNSVLKLAQNQMEVSIVFNDVQGR